jgi:DNA-binding winged helix-turn-helix (wHTH) protein
MSHYIFGPFSLDPEARVLLRDGEPVPTAGKTLDTLLLLVQNRGRLVDKDELLSRIWAGNAVEEANLTQSISTVRKVLGDNPKNHRYIATVAGRGYQFVAPVTEVANAIPPAASVDVSGKRTKRAVAVTILVLSLACIVWFGLRHLNPHPN